MIPWDWKKQSFGSEIEIIGHWIDCDAMTISLSDEKRVALAEELADFAKPPSHPLIRWTRMTGWANWGINIFPLGCWALQSSWDKMAGKTLRNAHVPPNTMTRSDQQWLSDALFKWKGKQLLDSMFWTLDSADATLLCDACPTGLGIWVPKTNKGYTLRLPPSPFPRHLLGRASSGHICDHDRARRQSQAHCHFYRFTQRSGPIQQPQSQQYGQSAVQKKHRPHADKRSRRQSQTHTGGTKRHR